MLSLHRRCLVEAVGTAYLTCAVVGSGLQAQRLAGSEPALVLLAASFATGCALFALLIWLGPLSGAHLNPAVSWAMAARGDCRASEAAAYSAAQLAGAAAGIALVHAMFGASLFEFATHARTGRAAWLSEAASTFGLIGLVVVAGRRHAVALPAAVALYIAAGFWFTPTGFANPALTLARAFTGSWAGIRLIDVPGFVLAQAVGAIAAARWFDGLLRESPLPPAVVRARSVEGTPT